MFHAENDFVNTGNQKVVGQLTDDSDDQPGHGGDHGGVDTPGEKTYVDAVSGHGHIVKRLYHPDHGSQESDHGSGSGTSG